MGEKPKFDPNKSFDVVDEPSNKPAFDPDKPFDVSEEVKKKEQPKSGSSSVGSASEVPSTLNTNHEITEESHSKPAPDTGATVSSTLGTTTYSSGVQAPVQTSSTAGATKPYKPFDGSEMKSKERDATSRKLSENLTRIQNDAIAQHSEEQKGINEANQKRKEVLDAMNPSDRKVYLDHERAKNDYNAELTDQAEEIQLKHYQDEFKQLNSRPVLGKSDAEKKRYNLVQHEIGRLKNNIEHRNKVNDEDPGQITQQFATGQMAGEDQGVMDYLKQQKIDNPEHYHDLVQKANSGKLSDIDKSKIVTNIKQSKSADLLRDMGISVARGYDKMNHDSPEYQQYAKEVSDYNRTADETRDLYKAYPELAKKELQKENLEKYLKESPKAGVAYSTLAAGYNGVADYAESLIGTGKAIADVVESPFTSEKDYMKTSDKMMSNIHDFIQNDVKLTTSEQRAFNKDGSINLAGILPAISSQAVNMILLIEGGKELTAVSEAAGMSAPVSEKIGTFATNMAMTYPEKVRSAMEDNGLSAKDARIMALTSATAESFIYSLNPLFGQGENRKGVEGAVALLQKGDKQAFAEKMTQLAIINPGKVTAQMVAADITDKISGYTANKILKLKDGDKFNDEYTYGDLMNTAAMTIATTWLLGGMGHKSMKAERDGAVLELSKNISKSVDYINQLAESGQITPEQQIDLLKTVRASEKVQQSIPGNLDADVKAKILPQMVEKHIIEEQNKGLDPIFQKENDKRIEEIDNQMKLDLGIKTEVETPVEKPVSVEKEKETPEVQAPETKKEYVKQMMSAHLNDGDFEVGSPEAKLAQRHYENKFERLKDETKVEKPVEVKKTEKVLPGNEETTHSIPRGKNLYEVKKSAKGELKITDSEGNFVSKATEKRVKADYEAKMDFTHGDRVPEDEFHPEMDNNAVAQTVIEKSNNPAEVVEALAAVPKVLEHGSDSKDAIIADVLGKIKESDFVHYSDASFVDNQKKRNYFHNGKGKPPLPLDVIAQEMSEIFNPEGKGDEIQPQAIVDFINAHPEGTTQFNQDVKNPLYGALKDKFKKLTGLTLTPRLMDKVLDQRLAEAGIDQAMLDKITTEEGQAYEDYTKQFDEAIAKGEIDPFSGQKVSPTELGAEGKEKQETRPDSGTEEIKPPLPPAGKEGVPGDTGKIVEAGASKRITEGREAVRKELKAQYDKDPIMYEQLSNDFQKKAAERLIERLGFEGTYLHVMNDRIPIDELPAALTAGRITELVMFDQAIKAEKAGNKQLADELFAKSDAIGEKTAMYLVKAGRVGAAMSNFVSTPPQKQVRSIKKAIDRNNEPKAKKADKDYTKIDKEISGLKKDAAKKVSEKVRGGHEAIEKAANTKVRKIREDRQKLFDKWKDIGKDGPVTHGIGITDEHIKVGAEIAANYIHEGYVRLDELAKKMRADFKNNLKHNLTPEELDRILQSKLDDKSISDLAKEKEAELTESFKSADKGTAVEKDEKARKFTQAQFEQEQKAIDRRKLADTIDKHYAGEGTMEEFQQTLMDDHGFDEKSATELAASIDQEVLKMAEKDITAFLDRKLGVKKEKSVDKRQEENNKAAKEFTDLVLAGAASKDKYRDAFHKKYGLVEPLTKQEEAHILDLAKRMRDAKGAIREQLAHELVKFMSQKFPMKKIDAFWAMYYPSILSGPSTHVVNIATNIFHLANELVVSAIKDIVKYPAELIRGKSVIPETVYKLAGLARGLLDGLSLAKLMLVHGGGDNKFLQAGKISGDDIGSQLFRATDIENLKFKHKHNPLRAWQAVYKFVPRFLSAADAMGYSGFRQMELTGQIRDRAINQGLRGEELRKTVMDDIWGTKEKVESAHAEAEKEMNAVGMSKYQLDKDGKVKTDLFGRDKVDPTFIRRTKEIISEKLNKANVEAAEKYARRMTFKDRPTGTLGIVANAVSYITRGRWNPLRPLAPFVNVPFNIANILIDNTPYGALRANGMTVFNGIKYIGNISSEGGIDTFLNRKGIGSTTHAAEEGHYFPANFGREYTNQLTKGIIASAGMVYLKSIMSWDPDDKEGKIMITGDHAGFSKNEGYERDKVYPRNCIFIRQTDGTWGQPIPYGSINPYALSLAILGNASDMSHSKNHEENEVLDYIAGAMLSSFKDLEDMLPLQGFANLADAVHDFNDPSKKDKTSNLLKSLEKTTLGVITMPLIPNMAKQIAKINDPRLWTPETQADIMWKVIGGTATDDNATIDIFGESIKRYPGEQFIPTSYYIREKDPVRRLLIDKNIFPSKVSDSMTYFDFTDPKSNSPDPNIQEEATKQIGDDKVKLRQMQETGGKLAHAFMTAHYDELSNITDRDILKKQVSKIFNEQRALVKSHIEKGLPMPTSYWPTKLMTEEQGEVKEEKSDLAKMRKLINESKKYK